MGWLIDKIRTWFCKHEYECLLSMVPVYDYSFEKPDYLDHYEWVYVCKKCKKVKRIKA